MFSKNVKKWNLKTIKQYWELIFGNGKIQMQEISRNQDNIQELTLLKKWMNEWMNEMPH